jgi:hypothetical protein
MPPLFDFFMIVSSVVSSLVVLAILLILLFGDTGLASKLFRKKKSKPMVLDITEDDLP